jgi:regulatory protein YycH of two-component signal transduction system YycFG
MLFVSTLNDTSIELDNTPLGDDYDENIQDYKHGELGVGSVPDDESEETLPSQEDVAVLIDGAAPPKAKMMTTTNYSEI